MRKLILSFLFVFLVIMFAASHATAKTKLFSNYQEIFDNFINEILSHGDSIDRSKLHVKELDLNGDGKMDYWLLDEEGGCGSSGCYGSSYLWTPNGYCEGFEVREHEIEHNKLPMNKCR